MHAIVTTDLTKKYGDATVVSSVTLAVERGEIFGLLGPNGAGKTTTFMMLSTLLRPTSGTAKVNGFDVASEPLDVRRAIGMVFQDPSSDDTLTGYENLKLHALMYDVPMRLIDKRIDAVLELVDLRDRKHDVVKTYSGGMRRRLEIARGFLHEPAVLFLDEPTLGLDPQTRQHIWEYIQSLRRRTNMTVMLTTHYMDEAERLCDRVAIIDYGRIVALDTPECLMRAIGGDVVLLRGGDIRARDLDRLPFVKQIEETTEGLRLSVENSSRNLPELLHVAGAVEFVETHSPNLNDVFLRYTGRQMREQSGGVMERVRAVAHARQKS